MTSPVDPFATPPPYGQQPPASPPPYGSAPGQGQQPGYGQPGHSSPGYGSPGYGSPPGGGWSGAPQTETKAMIALGLAIAAYTPTIPFIGAIAAIVLARMARRDILASGGAKTGLSLCSWAIGLSVVHLVLVTLFFLFLFAAFLLPFSVAVL